MFVSVLMFRPISDERKSNQILVELLQFTSNIMSTRLHAEEG